MHFIGLRSRAKLSVIAGGGMLMPTAFAPLSIVVVIYGVGYNAPRGLISDQVQLTIKRSSNQTLSRFEEP